MKIYSWNVNGIRSVYSKGLLQSFIKEHNPDILCLQETKAQPEQVDFVLPDYKEYWCSATRKGYSGTAIYTKVAPRQVLCGFSNAVQKKHQVVDIYGDAATEGRVTTLEFEDYYVVSVYVPNAKDDLSRIPLRVQWDAALLDYLLELEKTKPVLCGGDFNVAHQEIDLARPKPNRGKKGFTDEERQGFTNFIENGFFDAWRTLHPEQTDVYTWWSHYAQSRARNVGWRIDYWLVSNKLKKQLLQAEVHATVMGSDHCPVSITLK